MCAIIFVERRCTANVLYHFLKVFRLFYFSRHLCSVSKFTISLFGLGCCQTRRNLGIYEAIIHNGPGIRSKRFTERN